MEAHVSANETRGLTVFERYLSIWVVLCIGAGIVLAGASTEMVQPCLNWHERSKGAVIVKRLCAVLVILGGLWLIYTVP